MTVVDVVVERAVVRVDGAELATDVWRASDGRRSPALVLRTPYGRGDLAARAVDVDPLAAVRRGYAVVLQDVRGRGDSSGRFVANVDDGEDGVRTVAWIRAQAWSDGWVAGIGSSYAGCAVHQLARARPPGLAAVAPLLSGSLRTIWYPGGAPRLSGLDGWLVLLLREELERGGSPEREAELGRLLAAGPVARLRAVAEMGSVAAPIAHWLADDPGFWADVAAAPSAPLPAAHATGWYDVCQFAALETYARWAAGGAPPQILTIGPWDHTLAPVRFPELGLGAEHAPPAALLAERSLALFDVLRGVRDPGDLVPVMSFVLGANRWDEGTVWPPRDVRETVLALGGPDTLGEGDGTPAELSYIYDPADPAPTVGGAHSVWGATGPRDQAVLEARDDVLSFTTAPLERAVELAGSPVARLLLASDAPEGDVVVALNLVLPGGCSVRLSEGNLRARWGDGFAHRVVVLSATHVVLPAGSRLRLVVTSASFPSLAPHGHAARQRLAVGGAARSSLTLPVRGAGPW